MWRRGGEGGHLIGMAEGQARKGELWWPVVMRTVELKQS